MATWLLDTAVIIDVLNDRRGINAWLRSLLQERESFACCAITVAEVYCGMRPQEQDPTDALLSSLAYLDISRALALRAGRLRAEWASKGRTLALADTLIAATAIGHDIGLITHNAKHFPMQELTLRRPP